MASTTPAGLEIRPRQLDFDLPNPLPRHWHGGDAFKTHMFNAMSVLFPDGERFFIESVRLFRDQIEDPVLKEQIRGFIGQEGHHSHEHLAYNQRLRELGYDIDYLERGLKRRLAFVKKHLPHDAQLASTCAVEHFTAIMADALLKDPQWLAGADPKMARLWRWHALEETEHKAVAFDVMQKVAKVWYPRRVLALVETTLAFNFNVLSFTNAMLRRDGFSRWQRVKLFAKGLGWVYGPGGMFMGCWRAYWRYYKPGFHPWQEPPTPVYALWLDTFNRTGDPVEAGRVVYAAAT